MQQQPNKYIVAGKEVIELTQDPNGFWVDSFGTIFALYEHDLSSDEEVRAGIGWFSIEGYNREVKAHDYMYASSVYQAFNDRAEADAMLEEHMRKSWLQKPFYWISRLVGGFWWENRKTR